MTQPAQPAQTTAPAATATTQPTAQQLVTNMATTRAALATAKKATAAAEAPWKAAMVALGFMPPPPPPRGGSLGQQPAAATPTGPSATYPTADLNALAKAYWTALAAEATAKTADNQSKQAHKDFLVSQGAASASDPTS